MKYSNEERKQQAKVDKENGIEWFIVYRRLDCLELEILSKWSSRGDAWERILVMVNQFLEGQDYCTDFQVEIANGYHVTFKGAFEFSVRYLEKFVPPNFVTEEKNA